jgi:beta-lactamase regulating signal transducer with metallopeptidase domain
MTALAADLVLKASLILAIAAVLDRALRRRASAATRHFLWVATVAALLVMPLALTVLPAWAVAIPVPSSPSTLAPMAATSAATVEPTIVPTASSAEAAPAVDVVSNRRSFDLAAFLFALYSAGAVVLLVRLLAEQFSLRRLTASAKSVDDEAWNALVSAGARALQIRRPVRLLQSDDHVMPFVFGTSRPTIVLPPAASRWTAERRRAVILHELAHVARGDCLAQRIAAFACVLYWPHPGVWFAARRLRVEREFACDDRVLSDGTAAPDYARDLLEIAHGFGRRPAPATALGMARARQLEDRLLAVMDETRNRRPLERNGRIAAGVAIAALVVPVAVLHAEFVTTNSGSTTAVSDVSNATIADAQDRDSSRDRFSPEDFNGTWELRPARQSQMVYVSMRTRHSQNGRTLPLARFEGLNEPGATAAVRDGRIVDGTVHFTSRRDAGTFTLEGVCHNQMCGGTFSFAPDQGFAGRLAKYGIDAPTPSEQFELAMADVGTAYIDGVKAQGYATPDLRTLVRAGTHGVSLDYVKSMAGLGYKLDTLEPLIRMRDHGVDPEFVKGMADQGIAKRSADELVRLRDHGVDPEYVKGMHDQGYSADVTALVRARDHGVDPAFARGVAALGYKSVALDTLIQMRDHGVDPQFVRGVSDAGYQNVPIDTLVRMRDHGVDPNYIQALAELGYKDVPTDSLIRMRDHGVDAAFIRRVQERVGGHPDIDDLIRRRDHGYDGR